MRATISPDARVLDEEVPICRSCTVQKVRWILRGGVPTALSEWFDASDAELEDRTDLYLVFPGCESVGLKVRDAAETPKSKMEVKALRSSPEVVGYSDGVVGLADAWVKRTHPTDEVVDWSARSSRRRRLGRKRASVGTSASTRWTPTNRGDRH